MGFRALDVVGCDNDLVKFDRRRQSYGKSGREINPPSLIQKRRFVLADHQYPWRSFDATRLPKGTPSALAIRQRLPMVGASAPASIRNSSPGSMRSIRRGVPPNALRVDQPLKTVRNGSSQAVGGGPPQRAGGAVGVGSGLGIHLINPIM